MTANPPEGSVCVVLAPFTEEDSGRIPALAVAHVLALVLLCVLSGAAAAGESSPVRSEPGRSQVPGPALEARSWDPPPVLRPGSLPPEGRRGRFGLGPSSFALTPRLAAELNLHRVLFEMPNLGIRTLVFGGDGLLAGASLGARYTAFAVERNDGTPVNRAALEGDVTIDLRLGSTASLTLSLTDVAYDRGLEPQRFRSDGLVPGSRAVLESSVRVDRGLRVIGAGLYSWEFERAGGAAALAWRGGIVEVLVGGRWTPEAEHHRLVPLAFLTVLLGEPGAETRDP